MIDDHGGTGADDNEVGYNFVSINLSVTDDGDYIDNDNDNDEHVKVDKGGDGDVCSDHNGREFVVSSVLCVFSPIKIKQDIGWCCPAVVT